SYGIVDDLRSHDIEVKYMGQPLSEHLKSDDWHVLTF
ncbi:MAG: DsrE family protein, partial [Phycisphaerales bacterium]